MPRRVGKKKQVADAVKEQIKEYQAKQRLSVDVEWTMQALDFISSYNGKNPILRSYARLVKRNPNWVPSSRQTVQIHRIAHQERITLVTRDSLGNRLREREGSDEPTSLDEPDWL